MAGHDVVAEPDAGAPAHRALRPVRRCGQQPHRLREPVHGGPALRNVPAEARGPGRTRCWTDSAGPRTGAARRRKYSAGGVRRPGWTCAGALIAERAGRVVLDEPTTRLDPRRPAGDLGPVISELVAGGFHRPAHAPQYPEEADRLDDTIAVIDAGRVIAQGSPDELKAAPGGERWSWWWPEPDQLATAPRGAG